MTNGHARWWFSLQRRGIAALSVMPAAAAVMLLLSVLTMLTTPASAGQRVALVIGNGSYAHAPSLANPLNDARDIGTALERLGFAVTRIENAGRSALWDGLQKFSLAASASEVAVVFYAGHGIEVDRRNFLVPVDARLLSDADVEFEAVPLDLLSRAVERARGLRLIILDACRDNPFAADMQRAGATRSIGRGLARVEPSGETLVAYAAKEGTVAADGAGRNSPYTDALLAHLEEPGLEVGLMFRKVRDAVLASTGGRQEPFVYGSLSSRGAYLGVRQTPVTLPASATSPPAGETISGRLSAEKLAAERLFWESAKDSDDPADIQAYLEKHPGGHYEALARNRLARLTGPADHTPPTHEPSPASASEQPAPEAVEASLGLERVERRQIQLGLASLGYDPGPADGLFGRDTRGAIGRWQTSLGGAATGHLDAEAAKLLLAAGKEAARKQAAEEAARKHLERRKKRHANGQRRRRRGSGRRCGRAGCSGTARSARELVVVPAGSFTMGSPSSEGGRGDDEGPQHRVTITAPFAVGKHEVTRGEFAQFVEATGHSTGNSCWTYEYGEWEERSGRGWEDPGFRQDGREPAVCVNWGDAKAYVGWLSRKTGERYRLLSEAEWEHAARAGTRLSRYWGDEVSAQCAHANGYDRTAAAELDVRPGQCPLPRRFRSYCTGWEIRRERFWALGHAGECLGVGRGLLAR